MGRIRRSADFASRATRSQNLNRHREVWVPRLCVRKATATTFLVCHQHRIRTRDSAVVGGGARSACLAAISTHYLLLVCTFWCARSRARSARVCRYDRPGSIESFNRRPQRSVNLVQNGASVSRLGKRRTPTTCLRRYARAGHVRADRGCSATGRRPECSWRPSGWNRRQAINWHKARVRQALIS